MEDERLSGAELDRAVAERVMGWTDIVEHERLSYLSGFPPMDERAKTFHVRQPVPHYSTSIEAAMEVLDRFPVWNINKMDRPYSVAVSIHENEHSSRLKTFEVQALTVPEGACRAALAATGAKE